MNVSKIVLGALAVLAPASFAAAESPEALTQGVTTYKPFAGFNRVVGDTRFTGYFLRGPERCDVTLLEVSADDEGQTTMPRRFILQIAAGGRSELDAGPDSALAIACTADADALKLAPQARLPRAAKL